MYRTANLQSCILYIYSTNIGTEYFKHGIYSPFLSSSKCSLFHNSNLFGSVLLTFYIQCVLKFKKNVLNVVYTLRFFPLQNAVCFTILTCLVPVLFTFYIQDVLKFKKMF